MKLNKALLFGSMGGSLALACALMSTATTALANVYATDIKVDGALTNVTVPVPYSGVATISYILNEPATLGVTIQILSGATVVDTISIASPNPGTLRGLNSIPWGVTNSAGTALPMGGTYSLSITAAATGYTVWTQTSIDTNAGMPANFPLGIDVDKNTNSQFYGRVVMGCASTGANATTPAAAKQIGLFKMNADGSQADEGWFGYAGYSTNDAGGVATGQMNNGAAGGQTVAGYNPMKIRIADDDRIYWVDNSKKGAIIACDMQATTNQLVINGVDYASNPDVSDLTYGFQVFDVAFITTTNASLWLGDNDYPSWGYWMYHITNGAVDPADTGTQAVTTGGDLAIVSSSGLTVDTNLDIFCGQSRFNENAFYNAMLFSNWNVGVLPPESGGFNYSTGTAAGQVAWGYGCGVDTTCTTDPSFESSEDTVINSRTSPTIVACPLGQGANFSLGKTGGGIRLLNAQTGNIITVTNGSTVSTYTNLDNGQAYTCAAWDNVGNLYGASTTRNLWRAWSPPGANTNTTVAAAPIIVESLPPSVSLATSTFSGNANTSAPPITASFFGSAPLSLQWYDIDLSNHTNAVAGQVTSTPVSSTLTLNPLLASENGYQFFLVVSNSSGSATTTVATLTVYNTPQVTTDITPLMNAVNSGFVDSFSVAAVGAAPLSYQWYENGIAIPGQTNSTLNFIAAAGTNTYYVNVANSVDPSGVNSSTATVIAASTGLPVYEPFTEYASQVAGSSSNAIDLCTSGLTVGSLTWGSLNFNGLGLNAPGTNGIDVLVTNNSSSPFTSSALASLLPATFPGFPSTSINVMAVNPSQPGAYANTVGNSAVLVFASDFTRPASGTKTLYMSYLVSFAQKGQLGTGNDGRYLALLASTNLVEPSTAYPYWGNLFNTFGGSPRYAAHGLFDISATNAYIGPCDCSAGKDFSTSVFTVPLGITNTSGTDITGAPVFVVGAYRFNANGQDTNSMWVNPAIGSFGGLTPPGSPQNDVMPAGYNMSDLGGLCLIDRIGSGGAGGVGTNFIANLLVGSTWSYVTGGPEFTVQPMSVNASTAILSAIAVAAGQSVTYQWQHVTATTTNNLTDGAGHAGGSATVSGSTTSTLTLTGVSSGDAGNYQVVARASGTGYSLTSATAFVEASATTSPAPVVYAGVPITGAGGSPNAPVLHFSGTAGGTYHVWSTTNVALTPVESKWTLLGTGTFSGGADAFTCPTNEPRTEFYTITQP